MNILRKFKLVAKQNGGNEGDNVLDFVATLSQQGNKGTTHITHINKKEVEELKEFGNTLLNELGDEIEFGQISNSIYGGGK